MEPRSISTVRPPVCPALHRAVAVLFGVLALLANSCISTSAGDAGTADPRSTDEFASLAFLGDLVTEISAAQTQSFTDEGGSMPLGDNDQIVVAPGAFTEPQEITARRADIDLTALLGAPTFAKAYVVSTVRDVEPNSPVIIEIERPAAELRAVHIVGGDFAEIQVLGAETAQIPIHHFSEQGFLVFEAFALDQEMLRQRAQTVTVDADDLDADRDNEDATFFTACLATVSTVFGLQAESAGQYDAELTANIAASVCITALVRRNTPLGVDVSVDCVGDKIDESGTLRGAIDACIAEQEVGPADADSATSAPVRIADGVYTGENGHIWVWDTFEVTDDVVRVEVRGGKLTDFEYSRDWHSTIPRSGAAPDWEEGQVCTYLAFLDFLPDLDAARPVIRTEDEPGPPTIEVPGEMIRVYEWPDCEREYVPVSRQEDGTDAVADEPGMMLITQTDSGVTVQWATPDYQGTVLLLDG